MIPPEMPPTGLFALHATPQRVPKLSPKNIAPPCRYSGPLASLKEVDRVAVSNAREQDGVVVYTIEVFLLHRVNRIPTNVTTHRDPSRKPDYVVERRFRDFETLRQRVGEHARRELVGTCRYCNRFRLFLPRCYGQPRALVKLCASTDARKKLLESFLSRLVQLAVADECLPVPRGPRECQCPGVRSIPVLIGQFLREH